MMSDICEQRHVIWNCIQESLNFKRHLILQQLSYTFEGSAMKSYVLVTGVLRVKFKSVCAIFQDANLTRSGFIPSDRDEK